ncbi:MAG: acriflavine resistance protein B [Alphaproteobacteria bacterium]|nr:acriflavine resistance protein B [Alphaproteobacteria bacterium]
MTLPELCIRRPVMTTLIMVALVIFGIVAYRVLPVAELPNVDYPIIEVTATLPGASAETMASSVATVLEGQFSRIPGVSAMSSVSGEGQSRITLEFELDRSIDAAALDVQSAISAAMRRLPDDMKTPPSFRKINPADFAIFYLGLWSPTLPVSTVDEYAETLIAQRLSTISGVAQVSVWGQQKYAIRVRVDPDALATRGIGIEEVADAVRKGNPNQPTGSLSGQHQVRTLKTTGKLSTADAYNNQIVAYRNGAPVRLREIGRAVDSVENDKSATWFGDTQGIMLAVYRQPGSNTIRIVEQINALLPTIRAQLPESVEMQVMYDRAKTIDHSIQDMQFTLALAAGLVIMVIFLFLRNMAATMIASLALPISVIGTFSLMHFLGFSLNNLSLMALTLAVGFVVDDAIVMLENIVRHREKGEPVMQAALKGSREISFTILSITISLVAVFIPVIFMGGMLGRLLNEFAVTISAAIIVSGIVSLTLTPLLCSRLLGHLHTEGHGRAYNLLERFFEGMKNGYDRSLTWCLAHRLIVMAVFVLNIAATYYLYVLIQKDFIPAEDTGRLVAYTEGGQDISFEAMSAYQRDVAKIAAEDPNIEMVMSRAGASGSRLTSNAGQLFMRMKPASDRPEPDISKVVQNLRRKLNAVPGVKVFVRNPPAVRVGGRLSNAEYQYTLQDLDLEVLYEWAGKLTNSMARLPGFQDVTSDLRISSPTIVVKINRDKAGTMGITAEQIETVLASAYGSRQVSTIYTSSNQHEVILEVEPKFQRNPAALSKLYIRPANGRLVPLEAVASLSYGVAPLTVNHQGQLPSVTISFNLAPEVSIGTAIDSVAELEAEMQVPATLTTSFQGTAQAFEESMRGLGLLLVMAILVVYIVLGILYESFIHPLTILSGLPSAGLGALLTLLLFDTPLSLYAFVGIIMLVGIVKKNAIMMIDFALDAQRRSGMAAEEAIHQACLIRFRPIMMTTMAALAGSLPIAIGFGAGGEGRQPLGMAVVGGLAVSQILTLYFTPVIYLYMERLKNVRSRRAAGAETGTPHGDIAAKDIAAE